MLCCLVCKNELVMENNPITGQKLICSGCGHEYKITNDGIPLLVVLKEDVAKFSSKALASREKVTLGPLAESIFQRELHKEPEPGRAGLQKGTGRLFNFLTQWPMKKGLEMVGREHLNGTSVLHIGVGYANEAPLLVNYGAKLIALDLAAIHLRGAKLTAEKMGFNYEEYVCSAAERLPFKGATFDIAVIQKTVSYLEDPMNAISEACRVAKRVLIVGEPTKSLVRNIFKELGLAKQIGSWTGFKLFEISRDFLESAAGNKNDVKFKRYFSKSTEAALPPRKWVRAIDRSALLASLCINAIRVLNALFGRFGNNAIAVIRPRN